MTFKYKFSSTIFFYIWAMDRVKVIGVPEHFNFPWIELVKEQPLMTREIRLEWVNEPRGSGAMNKAIRENSADIAIVLTESFIKDKIEGNPGKIIGFHVMSPLVWGIYVPVLSKLTELSDIKNTPFLVSRMGSGSHLMTFLLAKQQGWSADSLQFEIIGNLEGARNAFKQNTPSAFLWEKFTTQPLVKAGEFRRIGEIPTPWPCFVMVASARALKEFPQEVKHIRDLVYARNASLKSQAENTIAKIAAFYGIEKDDISEWFKLTTWATDSQVSSAIVDKAMDVLSDLKLISEKIPVEDLVEENLVWLV
jgi:ABC-type nitrate/sulfonate/bicarbonate transport system substrate-binding protein